MIQPIAEKPVSDRPFNPSRLFITADARGLVHEVLGLLSSVERRDKRRQATAQLTHERAVSALVCDLVHLQLTQPSEWMTVELSKYALSPSTRRAPFMTEKFADLVKSLAVPEVNLVELRKGDQQSRGGLRTTIRPSAWLAGRIAELGLELGDLGCERALLGEPLELRGEKIKRFVRNKVVFLADKLPLPKSKDVTRIRKEMDEINAWIADTNLSWWGDEQAEKVDLGKRFLRRIFNNGSLEAGGRLYGGFWQFMEKGPRLDGILIDDQPIVSLDFAQSALRMAYAEVGVELPKGDLYAVSGLELYRGETKQIINALLCSDSLLTRFPRHTRGTMPKSWKFERPYSLIARYHAPLVPLFGSASGLRFMHDESEILIRVLLRLKATGISALPVHDCVLIANNKREVGVTRAVMEQAFEEVTGVPGSVEVEGEVGRTLMSMSMPVTGDFRFLHGHLQEACEGRDERDSYRSPNDSSWSQWTPNGTHEVPSHDSLPVGGERSLMPKERTTT